MSAPTRYRFADLVVSRSRRQVLKGGAELQLIPRYFDLLVLLIDRRPGAVSRQEIFDHVWSDVIVSDGALSQAVRTLRRTLGDNSRDPMFIRTVSRHGYSFVFPDVLEEPDDAPLRQAKVTAAPSPPTGPSNDIEDLVDRLIRRASSESGLEEQRDAAEQLHALGTAASLERLTARPGHARALALFRDARWDVAGAGAVPLFGQPEGLAAAWELIRLRGRQALRVAERRWAAAAAATAATGALAGVVGGIALIAAGSAPAPPTIVAVLAGLGAVAGAIGAAGVAAGIAAAEALARSRRGLAIVTGGAVGGFAVGLVAYAAVQWTLQALFGLSLRYATGPLEGLVLGGTIGCGYAIATRRSRGGGMATPTGRARLTTALIVAACCAAGGLFLSSLGRPLVGGLINDVAQASRGSQIALTPLAMLIGHPAFGPLSQALIAVLESGLFGFGLSWGLTRRPAQGA